MFDAQNRVVKVRAQSQPLLLQQVALTPRSNFINLSRITQLRRWVRMTWLPSLKVFKSWGLSWHLKENYFLLDGLILAQAASLPPK